ncbi:hypothetical protein [Bacillus velezensis]|uniref:hypothetical protein n=1 Tax=Bacillus velezensis TaxID=492670 RepID=UPI001FD354E4|nr:hypothetical protein [Bacillus velezensis]UOO16177.1 hypothetical protein KHA74_10350 [Bacillus velezensis]WNJ13863.1 hypothetical protein RJY17_00885 [Bacillus velezensis]
MNKLAKCLSYLLGVFEGILIGYYIAKGYPIAQLSGSFVFVLLFGLLNFKLQSNSKTE